MATNTFKCTQINLGRSRNALQELLIHLQTINEDIIFITEPYLGNSDTLSRKIPGYLTYQFPTKRHAKAIILIKDKTYSALGVSEFSNSNLCIVQLNSKTNKKIYLISIYIEPKTDEHLTLQNLDNFLRHTDGSTHIICGDFNGWHTAWGSKINNRRGNSIFDTIILHSLNIHNSGNTPTFETITHGRHRESIIDLTLSSSTSLINMVKWEVNLSICPSSDHNAILFEFTLSRFQPTKNIKLSTFKYNTNNVQWNDSLVSRFCTETQKHLPDNTNITSLTEDELENCIKKVTTAIQKSCDKVLPRATRPRDQPPWWSDELTTLKLSVIKNHHKLIKLKRRNLPLDQILEERNTLRKQYSDSISLASTENFKEFCNGQKKEDVWSITNRIIKTRPLTQPPSTLKLDNGTYTTNSKETAKALLYKFYPDDTPNINNFQNTLSIDMNKPSNNPQNEPPFSLLEIIECLKTMNHKKAPGSDHLTSDICFQFATNFPDIITNIMNRCLELKYFPKTWKGAIAKIIPKHNKTDFTETSSYRPIGLINVMGKLLEKLIINRLTHYINTNNLDSKNQFGFKLQTSSIKAIDKALETISRARTKNEYVIVTSLDIKSAFDSAWWPAIFLRLRHINCPKNIYEILQSYIKDRHVSVSFSDCSVTKKMTKGCIQGSVCGPTLWNLILDDLLNKELPTGCYMQAYADDVLLVSHSKNVKELEAITNKALNIITEWGKTVKLTFGPDKSQAIAITRKAEKCNIIIQNQRIKFTNQIKYLGIIIDNKLKFIKHVEYILEKAKKLFNKLMIYVRPTWGAHPGNVKIIYSHVIEPIICYAASLWSPAALKYKLIHKKLLSIQRLFSIKSIQGFRTISTAASISIAQLTPLPAKVAEVADIERTKLTGTSRFAPKDLPIEKPVPPAQLMHPVLRTGITFSEIPNLIEFNKLESSFTNLIFTDGSKHNDKVGAAYVIIRPNSKIYITKKFKLHDLCSVFQAELLAIRNALEWIIANKPTKTFIFSDCKSGLTELENPNTTNELAVEIHKQLAQARQLDLTIQFFWIRGHCGIPGNELADTAAKKATLLHSQPAYYKIPISHIKLQNKLISNNQSVLIFDKCSSHIKTLFSSHPQLNEYLNEVKPNFAITQLLTNHGYHKEYLHRFKITTNNLCPCDNTNTQSLTHLIQHCPEFAQTRHKHLASSVHLSNPFNLSEILNSNITIDTFHTHLTTIIASLKNFNNPP